MKNKVFLTLAAVAVMTTGLSACSGNTSSSPSPDEQVKQVVKYIKADGHKVDEIVIAVNPKTGEEEKRENTHWETEIKVKKNTKIAEVVIVIPGSNCKVELEVVLSGGLKNYYADEARDQNGKEMALPSDFPGDRPSPGELKDYMTKSVNLLKNKSVFSFCIGKPYKASTHSND